MDRAIGRYAAALPSAPRLSRGKETRRIIGLKEGFEMEIILVISGAEFNMAGSTVGLLTKLLPVK